MVDDIFVQHIGAALFNWINYVSTVQRGYVLAENSIIYPVSEFVGSSVKSDQIFLDKQHPNLNDRYLDLRFFREFNSINCEYALEFKYVRLGYTEGESENKRFFDDLLRLKIFLNAGINRKAYFLTCGHQLDFLKAFQSIGWTGTKNGLPITVKNDADSIKNLNIVKPTGFYSNWFKFTFSDKKGVAEFKPSDPLKTPGNIYDEFMGHYTKAFKGGLNKSVIDGWTIKTKLIYISDLNNLKELTKPMRVAIWEIE